MYTIFKKAALTAVILTTSFCNISRASTADETLELFEEINAHGRAHLEAAVQYTAKQKISFNVHHWEDLPGATTVLKALNVGVAQARSGIIPDWYLKMLATQDTVSFHCATMNLSSPNALNVLQGVKSFHLGDPGLNCGVIPKGVADLESLETLEVSDDMATAMVEAGFEIEQSHYTVSNFLPLKAWLRTRGEDYNPAEVLTEEQATQIQRADVGGMTTLDFDAKNGTVPQALYAFSSVTRLNIQKISDVPAGVSQMPNLRELSLMWLPHAHGLPDDLNKCTSLWSLHLIVHSGDYMPAIEGLNLVKLNLHCSHGNLDLSPLLEWTNLTHLSLPNGPISPVVGDLKNLGNITHLSSEFPDAFKLKDSHRIQSIKDEELTRLQEILRSSEYAAEYAPKQAEYVAKHVAEYGTGGDFILAAPSSDKGKEKESDREAAANATIDSDSDDEGSVTGLSDLGSTTSYLTARKTTGANAVVVGAYQSMFGMLETIPTEAADPRVGGFHDAMKKMIVDFLASQAHEE